MSVDAQEGRDQKRVHKHHGRYQIAYQLLQYAYLEVHYHAGILQDGG
jgi:hypothetical protein